MKTPGFSIQTFLPLAVTFRFKMSNLYLIPPPSDQMMQQQLNVF